MRAWTATLVGGRRGFGAVTPAAQAVPANFWGVVSAGDADRRTVPAAEARRRRQHPGADRLERGGAGPGAGFDWVQRRRVDWRRGDRRTSRCSRSSTAPVWGCRMSPSPAGGSVQAPKTLPVRTGAQRAAWTTFLAQAVARYGPNGTFWAENPADTEAADPHLADLERGELQVLRRQAQPGRVRASW